MKSSVLLALPSLAVALPSVTSLLANNNKRSDSWGGAVSLGPTKSTIINAVTTIIPGAPPATQNGMLFLWPGMSNGTGDLVQTTIEQWNNGNEWCGASTSQWCIRASLFGSFGQKDSDSAAIDGDQKVRIEYNLMSDGTTWEQNVTDADTGEQLSYFSYDSGPYMRGYGTGTECDEDCTGTISDQQYLNTVITLAEADTTFSDTLSSSGGATYTDLVSSEGGKVWTIEKMVLPAMS